MHAKVRPSWRALQLLTLCSILLCIIVVYTTTWGNTEKLRKYVGIDTVPKIGFGGLGLPRPSVPGLSTDVDHHDEEHEKGAAKDEDILEDGQHPIQYLIKQAQTRFEKLVAGEAKDPEDAVKKYRKRRGRHPPPGFDAWYNFATEKGAVVVEDFFDQIYHDLGPFWGTEPHLLRQLVHAFSPRISIRSGKLETEANVEHGRLEQWTDMFKSLANYKHVQLPDMDIPLNINDEPAMLVPWEAIDTTVSLARPILPSPSDIISEYSSVDENELETANFTFDPDWLGPRLTHPSSSLGPRPFWSLVRPACHPDSKSRFEHIFTDIWHPEGHTSIEHAAGSLLPLELPEGTLKGYVKNWTTATDPCSYPKLQGLHGAFVAPEDMSATKKLFPLFGASKMSVSNEILIPGGEEWNTSLISPAQTTLNWTQRENKLYWRGPASGGRNSQTNWQRFQRHRFVSMMNATHIEIAEASIHTGNESTVGLNYAKNFRLLPANEFRIAGQTGGRLAEWVNDWADVGFTDLHCHEYADGGTCPYTNEYFSVGKHGSGDLGQKAKYAAVLDGNGGDSSELIESLKGGKMTLRASVYRNWYDSRIIPWVHFVPMDNTFVDLYAIMEYYLGTTVSEDAKEYAHAVGEVQHHEHHFKTPPSIHDDNDSKNIMEEDNHEHAQNEKHEEYTAEHMDHDKEPEKVPVQHDLMHDAPPTANPTNIGTQGGNEPHDFGIMRRKRRDEKAGDGHDAQAKKIAEAGKEWAEKVLRREDMLIYVYRLLLEYARVLDDSRERLGYVGDLVGEES